VPYLQAAPNRAARWRTRIAEAKEPCRVGLVWASQSQHRTAAAKSVTLDALSPLGAVPGVRFFSLQKGEAAEQARRPPPGMRLTDLSAELADFADTAAALTALDLVISVDTAVAHLAGALGRPAWTLLKFAPDWRWLLAREDCPWYPTMRLFRQVQPGDWGDPVARLSEALRSFAGSRTNAGA
jgi:ADP-heptose:LPS heptosyltransferase